MAMLTLVINGVSQEQFERMIDIQTKSAGSVKFLPQGGHTNNVQTQPMNFVDKQTAPPQPARYDIVRFECKEEGAKFLADIVKVFEKS